MRTRVVLCNADEVAEGTALQVELDDLQLAVFNVAGTFHVTDDECTHGPGLLSEGYLSGCVIECDFHGGSFDVRTGAVVAPPCLVAIRTYPVFVDGGKVVVEVDTDAA